MLQIKPDAIMDLQRVGNRIKQFRKRQGLTQEQVASYLDLSRPQISLIESGERSIDLNKLEKLANLFGINLAVFISEDEMQLSTELAFAFRSDDVNESDLEKIAQFKRIVKNHQKMKKLVDELEN